MQPIRGRGRGKGRVDRRGRDGDGERGHGRDGEGGRGTPEPTLPTSIPPHTYLSLEIFIPPHIDTSPSIPLDTYTSLPYPVSTKSASIAVDITFTFSSHPLSSPTSLTLYQSCVYFQLGDLVLHVYVKYFIHQLLRLPRLHQHHQLHLRLHETLLINKLYILGVVLREI